MTTQHGSATVHRVRTSVYCKFPFLETVGIHVRDADYVRVNNTAQSEVSVELCKEVAKDARASARKDSNAILVHRGDMLEAIGSSITKARLYYFIMFVVFRRHSKISQNTRHIALLLAPRTLRRIYKLIEKVGELSGLTYLAITDLLIRLTPQR